MTDLSETSKSLTKLRFSYGLSLNEFENCNVFYKKKRSFA